MLRVLIASQPARTGWFGGTTFSTVTHGALIALAVVSSGGAAASNVREERAAEHVERITFVAPTPPAISGDAKSTGAGLTAEQRAEADRDAAVAAIRSLQELADAAVTIPDVTAATDLTAVTDAWLAQPDGLASESHQTAAAIVNLKSGFVAPANGVYTADLVERSVEAKNGNPKPRYPTQLANMGIEGAFTVKFVVDSSGRVPESTIEFPSTMHRLFASAVRTALLHSHYFPALIGGRRVQQEVVQEFNFSMGRRR